MTRRDCLRASAWLPGWLLGAKAADSARVVASDRLVLTATVKAFRPATLGEVWQFHLTSGTVTLAIMGDDDLGLTRWLRGQDGKRITLALEPTPEPMAR